MGADLSNVRKGSRECGVTQTHVRINRPDKNVEKERLIEKLVHEGDG